MSVEFPHAHQRPESERPKSQQIDKILSQLGMELRELISSSGEGRDEEVCVRNLASWHRAVENMKVLLANRAGVLDDLGGNCRDSQGSPRTDTQGRGRLVRRRTSTRAMA